MSLKVFVAGGGLQGIEVLYLAKKAGWTTVLCDRNPAPPALGLADRHVQADLTSLGTFDWEDLVGDCDFVIPALENRDALKALSGAEKAGLIPPLIFDDQAFAISSSKELSKKLFRRLDIPTPKDYGSGGKGPFVAKPISGSGSQGVAILPDRKAVKLRFPLSRQGWIVEEYANGPSYSVEVTASKGHAQAWTVTRLEVDELYDCQQVLAPHDLTEEKASFLCREAERLALGINLKGLMDLEVILTSDGFKALEIDARFPSQTPTAVWWSTGVNLLRAMVGCFMDMVAEEKLTDRKVRYEHILYRDGKITGHGEHLMTGMGPLTLIPGFHGAREALVAGDPRGRFWAATLIYAED